MQANRNPIFLRFQNMFPDCTPEISYLAKAVYFTDYGEDIMFNNTVMRRSRKTDIKVIYSMFQKQWIFLGLCNFLCIAFIAICDIVISIIYFYWYIEHIYTINEIKRYINILFFGDQVLLALYYVWEAWDIIINA